MTAKVLFSVLCMLVSMSVYADNQDVAKAADNSDEQVYELPKLNPENMPKYPGGMSAMMAFIQENMKYPNDAKEAKKEGRVLCSFVIDKTGEVTEVKVAKSSGTQSLDDEAVRVVSLMPNWTPGTEGGKPVRVLYTIPLVFRL